MPEHEDADIPTNEGHGEHWVCLFRDIETTVTAHLPQVVSEGSLLGFAEPAPIMGEATAGLWWPGQAGRGTLALVAINAQDEDGTAGNLLMSAYPAVLDGPIQPLTIQEVLPWSNGIEGLVRATFPEDGSGPEIAFFDTLFYLNRDRYRPGLTLPFRLAAFAYWAQVVHPEPVVIDKPEAIEAMRKGTEREGDMSSIEVIMSGAAILFPRDDLSPDDAEAQGPVRAVDHVLWAGVPLTCCWVTVVRLLDREDEDIDIPVFIAPHVWRTGERPEPGNDLQALIWIQGCLADNPAVSEAEGFPPKD